MDLDLAEPNSKNLSLTGYLDTENLYLLRRTYFQSFLLSLSHHSGNYYGTPKPPAEPSPVQPDLVDQVLFDEEFDTEVQRKRTTSVSKMDRKDSVAPDEDEEEERPPMVNGLAGERHCFFRASHYNAPYPFSPNLKPNFLFITFLFIYLFSSSSLYYSQKAKQQGPLFPPYHSFPILRISCSVCKVSTKSQEVAKCLCEINRSNPSVRRHCPCLKT